MEPRISVLMANYNKAPFISGAILSVMGQTINDFELIIMDDGSSDGSIVKIKKFLGDSRIQLFSNKKNQGKTETLKELIKKARGEIIGILDSDDSLEPNALDEVVRAHKKYPDCGYIYTQCNYCDRNLKPVHLGFSARIPEGKTNLHVNTIVAMRTYKKSVYFQTDGYDKEILYAEDIDLSFKMEEVTKLLFINKPLYNYRILPKSQSHSFKNTQINRSSTALAKLKAYKRRLGADVLNLNRVEMAVVLFFGFFSAILGLRLGLAINLIKELFDVKPFFFVNYNLYRVIFKKIRKILLLKKDNRLLKI
ncbi:glycosyltransferase [bacterium]|nr:glycosyltransferase [bacterium]